MGLEDLDKLDAAFGSTEAAKGGNFAPMPDGTKCKLVVSNQKPAIVGEKKTPVVKVTFEVAATSKEYDGKKVWHDFWLTEANLKYLKRDLLTLGWPGLNPDGSMVTGYKITQLMRNDDSSLMYLGAEVTVGVEPYSVKDPQTGEEQQRFKNIINFFNAKYVHPIPSKQQPGQPPGKPVAGSGAPGGPDDPIPF